MNDKESQPEEKKPTPKDVIVETRHTLRLDGRDIPYTATAGRIILKEESEEDADLEGEKPKAAIFFISYTREDMETEATRPITFSFNGGPGSSSVWLHLGLLGPKRVSLGEEGDELPAPPYSLVENEYSLLDVTDLVFIDPVSTGFSRPTPGEKAKEYHGFKKDIESVGDFIRLFTTRFGRWTSPKFLIGESYGTTRAAGLSDYLQDRHGLYLNGIMLVSSVLNFGTLEFEPGNDLPFVLYLPSYAATAWYHNRLSDDLQGRPLRDLLEEVEEFAIREYLPALFQGAALQAERRVEIIRRLAHYTGLSETYLERTDLRIELMRFTKELLRDRHRTTGRLDSRFLGIDRDAAGENFEHDPSLSAITGPYTATLNDYVRRELGFESDLPYEILTGRVQPWSFAEHENRFLDVAETLRKAMSVNPHLRIHVANGYYDLATPYFATEYTFNHLGLDPSLYDNITMSYYDAGHMMYVHQPSLAKLKEELAGFIRTYEQPTTRSQ